MAYSFSVVMALSLVAALLPPPARAQTYPIRPVRLVVPYPPGGATDFTAREISQALSESMGQQFVVDNRSGAAGTMGHYIVAKAAPDGYTLVVGTFGGLVTGPALMGAQLPPDPEKDFVAIGLAVHAPWALVLNPAVPAKSVKELIDLGESCAGQAELCVYRYGHAQSPRDGVAPDACRYQHGPRSLSQRGSDYR